MHSAGHLNRPGTRFRGSIDRRRSYTQLIIWSALQRVLNDSVFGRSASLSVFRRAEGLGTSDCRMARAQKTAPYDLRVTSHQVIVCTGLRVKSSII